MLVFNLDLDYLGRPKSIFLASYLGNLGGLNRMLNNYKNVHNVHVKAHKHCDHTVLHFACYGSSNLATVIALTITGKADCFALDTVGRTSFHIAGNSADPEIVNYLINNMGCGFLIDVPDYYGRTPLHALCCSGSSTAEKRRGEKLIHSLQMLLENFGSKAEVVAALHREDNFGLSPLMLAKFYGFEELYSIFAKLDIDICAIPLIDAEHHGVAFDYFGRTTLMEAAFDNKLLLVKEQLANQSNSDDPNLANEQAGFRTPLLLACCSGQDGIADVVAAILDDARTDPLISDIDNSKALHFAAYVGRDDVVKLLLSNKEIRNNIKYCIDDYGMTPLHTLALSDKKETMRLECINLLLKNGIDIFAEDNAGRTAYDLAVAIGNEVVAEALFHAMCGCYRNEDRNGGNGPSDGLAPLRLIALEKHIWVGNGFPNSTIPVLERTHHYHYDSSSSELNVSTKLRFVSCC